MTRTKTVYLGVVIAAVVFLLTTIAVDEGLVPSPVEKHVSPPEQSPYAVFYVVCGQLRHVLMTTEPPLTADSINPASKEMLDMMKATPKERILELRYVGPECFYGTQPKAKPING